MNSSSDHDLIVIGGGKGLLRDCRLYQVVRQRDVVRERTAELAFLEPGVEAYSFTFA
jgi:Thioredoxin like C-terminal domain